MNPCIQYVLNSSRNDVLISLFQNKEMVCAVSVFATVKSREALDEKPPGTPPVGYSYLLGELFAGQKATKYASPFVAEI